MRIPQKERPSNGKRVMPVVITAVLVVIGVVVVAFVTGGKSKNERRTPVWPEPPKTTDHDPPPRIGDDPPPKKGVVEPPPTSVEVTITEPAEDEEVDYLHRVAGTVSDPTLHVLVVVITYEDSEFWVQDGAQVGARIADDGSGRTIGKWYTPVYFGRSAGQDQGKKFMVMAIATRNPEEYDLGERLGPIPSGVAQSDPVTVTRK